MKIGLAGIVKNEANALLEWIAFHRVVGVNHFFIADNESTDGTREMLTALQRADIIDVVIDIPTLPSSKPQLPAYEKLLALARGACDVLAFIDADEFIVPTGSSPSIIPLMERIFSDEEVSALALNWSTFGSNGALFVEDGLVIDRFTKRAKADFSINLHIKTVVRPERAKDFHNPHYVNLSYGRYVNTKGEPLQKHPRHGNGLSASVCWDSARVNHYAVKSLEEFILGKSRRGSASKEGRVKHKRYFTNHDRNDEICQSATRFSEATRAEVARLTGLLSTSMMGGDAGNEPTVTAVGFLAKLHEKLSQYSKKPSKSYK